MADKSSYLRFLPSVLWENEAPPPALSLGAALRVFEKILSGIDDTAAVIHGDHEHIGIEQAIARIHRIFQPWATPADFLPWLASWVALELDPIWDEYQQRKLISQMVQIYKLRGLKPGLQLFLELHTVAGTRPRITIDDCSKILTMEVFPGRASRLATLVSQRPLIHPLCIAVGPDGSLFVGDHGTLVDSSWSPTVHPAVYRFRGPSGDYPYSAHPPHETPIGLGAQAMNLAFPIAIAVEGNAASYRVYVLDNAHGPLPALYRLDSANGFAVAMPLANFFSTSGGRPGLGLKWPMAMAFDSAKNLLILDRGVPPDSHVAAKPSIVEVKNVQFGPAVVDPHPLSGIPIVEPTCLVVQADGSLVIGDAGIQPATPPDPQQASPPYASFFAPADLVRIDRNAGYLATSLLGGMAPSANPLVAPQAVVLEDVNHLLVVDSGLRPFRTMATLDPFLKTIAEPAAVYRVDLSAALPTVTLASDRAELVSPVGAAMGGNELFVVDFGDHAIEGLGSPYTRLWRAVSDGNGVPVDHEMGVTIYFALPRPPTQGVAPPPPTKEERFRVVENIRTIIDSEKPAHIRWTKIFEA